MNDSLVNIHGVFNIPDPVPACAVCGAEEDAPCSVFNPTTGLGEDLGNFIHAERLA